MRAYKFAVAAALRPKQLRRDVLSRHVSADAAEKAARRQNKWNRENGYPPVEAVCLDRDGEVSETIADCRDAGTLE